MATSIFDVKAHMPDDGSVASVLGQAKPAWDRVEDLLRETCGEIAKEWKFYSKKSGWSLVFKNKGKTLLYTLPCREYFKVWFVLGAEALEAAKQAPLPEPVLEEVRTAITYAEGTSFSVDVHAMKDLDAVKLLLSIKMEG